MLIRKTTPKKTIRPAKNREPANRYVDASRAKLRERVKELTCLYGLAQTASNPDLSLERKLIDIVCLLPPAWQYPKHACARISIDGKVFQSPEFRDGTHCQTASIRIGGSIRGDVEIHYPEIHSPPRTKPFLKEEQDLINNIARQIALLIEHEEARTAKAEFEKQMTRADRLSAIGQLAAGVAHELNEPLNTILGFAQLTQKAPDLPGRTLKDLEKIAEAALHARSIIRELLIFAHPDKPGSAQVSLNHIITDELNLYESLCCKSGVELRRIVDPDLPNITANKAQIRQIISNLTVNALQAMPKGGVLTIRTSFNENSICFVVEDNGIGMSDEVKESIFLPFYTTKDVDQGTGLGLSVVHGIVSSHKGRISVESEKGRGSRFLVTFPRQETVTKEEAI